MDKKKISKEEIVAEYLTGNISYRALEKKYGVPSRSICDWVLKYQGRLPSWKEKENALLNWQIREVRIARTGPKFYAGYAQKNDHTVQHRSVKKAIRLALGCCKVQSVH